MSNHYPFGSSVTVASAFQTILGVPIDPTTVTLRVKDPNGNETVTLGAFMVHAGVGVWTFAFVCLVAGVWWYRFEGTGAAVAVQEGNFVVASSQFADAAS